MVRLPLRPNHTRALFCWEKSAHAAEQGASALRLLGGLLVVYVAREVRAMRERHDPKFEVRGSKFRKPRTSDLEPSLVLLFPPVSHVTRVALHVMISKELIGERLDIWYSARSAEPSPHYS